MIVRFTASCILLAGLCGPAGLRAQTSQDSIQTPNGWCAVWASIPGGSNPAQDASYNRCALERGPVLRAGQPMPAAPWFATEGSGEFTVIVNADGTVDPRLTRGWTRSSDSLFYRRNLDLFAQWRFEPGIRDGTPVRSGFRLHVRTGTRNDTLPSRLEWTYTQGLNEDSLTGTWIAGEPLPPFTPAQSDSVHLAVLRRLVRMKVLAPGYRDTYCLVLQDGDAQSHARLSSLAERALFRDDHHGTRLQSAGCERSPGPLRIFLSRAHRTENGRAVVYTGGDYLPNWPPGFNAATYRAWRGRCVADVRADGSVWTDCSVGPEFRTELGPAVRQPFPAPAQPAAADVDSLRVTLIAMTLGAYQTDTLRTVMRALPRLRERAIRDSTLPCGGWAAFSLHPSAALYVIKGNPASSSLDITEVRKEPAPQGPAAEPECRGPGPQKAEFVAFLLGDQSDRAREPVTLCFFGGTQCGRRYVLDPARHTLAERAHVRFRFSDLREDTRVGDQLVFRIYADPAPQGLLPLVIVRRPEQRPVWAWIPRQVGPGEWHYGVTFSDGYHEAEVFVYLMGR